ncbi:hypothetical protein [Nonomuraea sp. NPDC023979]|uniref:hypothetical protein n=1 Tax=Nonomuraea sp. NPDC023979 TaxID=3154796 RepID=UPI0033DCB115
MRPRERGRLLLLVGESSTGKTRCAFEAIRTLLPHWWLLQPDDVEQIRRAAASPPAQLVVWLDELQNHLLGTSGLTPDLARRLTRSGVLLIATMREEYYRPYARLPGPGGSRGEAAEWEVVRKLATPITIRAKLSVAEQGRVRAAAEHDGYLRAGLQIAPDDPFQAVAGVPLLIRHADGADPYARAVLEAGVDAARLGVLSPLSAELLQQAARGYGDERQ